MQSKGVVEGGLGYMCSFGDKAHEFKLKSVLKDFAANALTIVVGSVFQKGRARTLTVCW